MSKRPVHFKDVFDYRKQRSKRIFGKKQSSLQGEGTLPGEGSKSIVSIIFFFLITS